MKTGEGKTLVATLPAYLNALTGEGVHIVTVNDYLAKRDSEWMGKVYRFLGLTVGLIVHGVTKAERKAAYDADITYGTNNEFGFDYLRDNMAIYDQEHGPARPRPLPSWTRWTPSSSTRPVPPSSSPARAKSPPSCISMADQFAPDLDCYVVAEVDDKEFDEDVEHGRRLHRGREGASTATLTARGIAKAEQFFHLENLADAENTTIYHHINQAIQRPRRHEAGHRLRGQGRPGHHRGRVHRPSHVRPSL